MSRGTNDNNGSQSRDPHSSSFHHHHPHHSHHHPSLRHHPPRPPQLRILLWNVKGLVTDKESKLSRILAFARLNCDLLLLTETHITSKRFDNHISRFLQPLSYIQSHHWAIAPDNDNWAGTGIINFNPRIALSNISAPTLDGRLQLATATHQSSPDHPLYLALIYAPPRFKERQIWITETLRPNLPLHSNLLAGDFNCVSLRHDLSYTARADSATFIGSEELSNIVKELDLTDAYLALSSHPTSDPLRFTFHHSHITKGPPDANGVPTRVEEKRHSRLDRFYLNLDHLVPIQCRTLTAPSDETGTTPGNKPFDHSPLILRIHLPEQDPFSPIIHAHQGNENDADDDLNNVVDATMGGTNTPPSSHPDSGYGPRSFQRFSTIPLRIPNHWFLNEELANLLTDSLSQGPFATASPESGELMIKLIVRACRRYKKEFEPIPPYRAKQMELEHARRQPNPDPALLDQLRREWTESLQLYAEYENERMRKEWDMSNDQLSRQMAWRVKKRKAQRWITEIKDPVSQQSTRDPAEIMRIFETYYADLYQKRPHCENSLQSLLKKWYIDPQQRQRVWSNFHSPITQQELDTAIAATDNGKSPGDTGLTYFPFKRLATVTSSHLLALYNGVWTQRYPIPNHWKRTMITTIHKGKGAPEDQIESRRPISLLNTDYKIFAKIVAKRLGAIAVALTLPNQTGFVPGRNIQDNIIAVLEAMNNAEEESETQDRTTTDSAPPKAPLVALFDFHKAFDRVSHEALERVLYHIGCPRAQRSILLQLCSEMRGRIQVNGRLSRPIPLKSGVRQGCPIAPILFVFVIELLNRALMSDPTCHGLRYNPPDRLLDTPKPKDDINKFIQHTLEGEYRTTMHADDVATGATNLIALQQQLEWIDIYCKATCAKLNENKSEILDLYNKFSKRTHLYNIPVQKKHQSSRYLGIWLGARTRRGGIARHSHKTTNEIIDALITQSQSFTLHGKSQMVNAFMLAKLWYIGTFDPPSSRETDSLERSIMQYVWSMAKTRMRWDRMIAPYANGGLAITDIESKIQSLQCRIIIRHLEVNKSGKDRPIWHNAWSRRLITLEREGLPRPRPGRKLSYTLQRCLEALEKFVSTQPQRRLELDPPLTAKIIFLHLVEAACPDSTLTPTMVEMQQIYQMDFNALFPKIWDLPVQPRARELFWRTITKTQNRNYARTTRPKCPRCHTNENNTIHMMVECPDSEVIWDLARNWYQCIFPPNSPVPPTPPHRCIWNLSESPFESSFIVIVCYFIWKRFNAFLHKEKEKAALQSLNYFLWKELQTATSNAFKKVQHSIHNTLGAGIGPLRLRSSRKIDSFKRTWKIGTLCDISNNGLITFHPPPRHTEVLNFQANAQRF